MGLHLILASRSPGQSALIIGATGATGKHVLKELLASPNYTRVGEYGRRVTPLEQITAGKEKLEQKAIDFDKVEEAGLSVGKWDVVFITYVFPEHCSCLVMLLMQNLRLGTTRKAVGSDQAFEKIDRE